MERDWKKSLQKKNSVFYHKKISLIFVSIFTLLITLKNTLLVFLNIFIDFNSLTSLIIYIL